MYGINMFSCLLSGVRVMEKTQKALTYVCLREVYEPAIGTWEITSETGELLSKKEIQQQRFHQKGTDWVTECYALMFLSLLCHMYKCNTCSRGFQLTRWYNVKGRCFPSLQTSAFVYVHSGVFLKGLMFSGEIFSVKCVLKEELTITFAEYP